MAGAVSHRPGGESGVNTPSVAPGGDPHEHVDPFTYRPRMTVLDWVKVVFNTVWLVPLRLLLLVLPSVAVGIILSGLTCVGDRLDEDNPHPLRGWRRFLISTVCRYLPRMFLFGMGFHRIRVSGVPASTAEAPLWVVAPHSSMLDIFIISCFHVPTTVAKQEVRSVPLFGYLTTHSLRTIYVNRNDPLSRQRCTAELQRRARDQEAGWPKVLLFPEGTTHSREVLLQFKKGAFLHGLPVQAVAIKYQNRSNTMVWGDHGQSLLTSLFLTICQFHNSLEVEFLPVHTPSSEEVERPELFAENVRSEVSRATDIPVSSYSFEDLLLCRSADGLGLPYRTGLVSYPTVHRDLHLSLSDVKRWLCRFAVIDTDKDGLISAEDLLRYLAVPSDACSQAVFTALTKGAESKLSFRYYLHGVVGMSLPFSTDEALRDMFQFFDSESKGVVTLEDISSRLPVQWNDQSDVANARGSPPPRRRGCDMCGCGRGRTSRRRGSHAPQLASLPAQMTFDQFRSAMLSNREYLLLYHECQEASLSSPQPAEHMAVAIET